MRWRPLGHDCVDRSSLRLKLVTSSFHIHAPSLIHIISVSAAKSFSTLHFGTTTTSEASFVFHRKILLDENGRIIIEKDIELVLHACQWQSCSWWKIRTV